MSKLKKKNYISYIFPWICQFNYIKKFLKKILIFIKILPLSSLRMWFFSCTRVWFMTHYSTCIMWVAIQAIRPNFGFTKLKIGLFFFSLILLVFLNLPKEGIGNLTRNLKYLLFFVLHSKSPTKEELKMLPFFLANFLILTMSSQNFGWRFVQKLYYLLSKMNRFD